MAGHETLRPFIPFGYCVSDDPSFTLSHSGAPVREVFHAIDNGHESESLYAIAETACLACIQINHCRDQRDKIGNALWRAGTPVTVAGGERVGIGPEPDARDLLETSAFRFDLSTLPTEPSARLGFLRQGVRAGQLRIETRRPTNVGVIGGKYEDMLTLRRPDMAEALAARLSDQEHEKAFRYIVLSVCQQADFRHFSARCRSSSRGALNPRYNPDTHDYEAYYPTVELYLQEALEVSAMGYKNPGQMAMYYSAEAARRLLAVFGPPFTPPSKMKPVARYYEIVRGNIRNPGSALTAFLAKEQSHRVNGADAPPWVIRQRSRNNRPSAGDPREQERRSQLLASHGHLGAVTVERALVNHGDPEDRLTTIQQRMDDLVKIYGEEHPLVTVSVMKYFAGQEGYKEAVVAFLDRLKALEALYGNDRDFTTANIRLLARQYPETSLSAAAAYKRRLERFRSWAAAAPQSYGVPDSYLRQRALQGDLDSYEDIAKAHIIKTLKSGLYTPGVRQGQEARVQVDNWMFNQLARLYPAGEVREAGKNLIHLIRQGMLTAGLAELSDLQDPVIQLDVDSMADPNTRKYLTFAAELDVLAPQQRLALAHEYNLTRLLYGRAFAPEQVAAFLGPDMPADYGREQVEPRCIRLVSGANPRPLPFSVIQRDVVELLQASSAPERESSSLESGNLFAIIGANVVQLTQAHFEGGGLAAILTDDQRQWIERQINAYYPPLERAQNVQDVAEALRGGRVIIKGNTPATYRLSLGDDFSRDHVDQADRAVIAHVMGVDNLLYGKNLNLTLRYRLGTQDLTAYMLTAVLPKLATWKAIGTALTETRVTPAAFRRLIAPFDVSQLWRVRRKLVAVSESLVIRLQEREFPERPTSLWKSHRDLAAMTGSRTESLSEVVGRLNIGAREQLVCRLPGTDTSDLFYSPRASNEILRMPGK